MRKKLFSKLLTSERGDIILPALLGMLLMVFFTLFIIDASMGYSARQEVQKISDAAAMGGSAMGAVGYKNIAVNGGNATAVIQRAEAINTANKIFRLNMNGNKINKYVTVNKVKYNQDATIDGKTYNMNQLYYSGYFTTDVDATYTPITGAIPRDIHFSERSIIKATPVE